MARVDYAEAWLALRRELVHPDEHGRARQGIGIDKLLALMGRLEAEHEFDEGHLERTLRRYGVVFADDLIERGAQSAPPERPGAEGDDQQPAPSSRGDHAAPKESTCQAPLAPRPPATTSLRAA